MNDLLIRAFVKKTKNEIQMEKDVKFQWVLENRLIVGKLKKNLKRAENAAKALEELLCTLERSAIDNSVTIRNVSLFAKEWRKEAGIDIE